MTLFLLLVSCYAVVVILNIDTTLSDPSITATIIDIDGQDRATMSVLASELHLP